MDREEFKLRTDEIKSLAREGRYPEAVRIADSIDWKRVKNWKLLCTVGDLYKKTGDLEKSRNAMLLAYDRNPSNPTIVYSLCELAIKLGDLISSVEYMKEYARLNPGDAGVLILRYKMYEEQGVSLAERAELLEQYQTYVFKPKWGYELASLYHGIGDEPRLIGECDAIFDYFAGDMSPSSHRYVLKSLELKELHTVLSPAQQAYLDSARAAEQAKRDAEEAERRRIEEEARAQEAAREAAEAERERWAAERRAARADGDENFEGRRDSRHTAQIGVVQGQVTAQTTGPVSGDTTMYGAISAQQTGAYQAVGVMPATEDALDGRTTVFNPVRDADMRDSALADSPTRVMPQMQGYAGASQPAAASAQTARTPAGNAGGESFVPMMNPYDTTNLQQELAKNVQDVMPDSGYEQEVFTGYHPNPYEKPKSKTEKPQSGHRGAIRHKQRRYDNILSLEGDGQISLVLPEDEVIERQITGQISIDDIMERLRNYSKETQEARVEQIVRGRTDGMFNSFERQAKEGPQVELDKMLGLDRVTARDVTGMQESKKVSLIQKPAVAAVIRPESPAAATNVPGDNESTAEDENKEAETAAAGEVVATTDDDIQTTKTEADLLKEKESADKARVETTDLNLHMGTAESAAALETAKAGIQSEKKATAIETADATSSAEEAATALETNETTTDSAKAAMALANASASDIISGAAATTAGAMAAAGVMTVGAPAFKLSGEAAIKEKEEAAKAVVAEKTAKAAEAETAKQAPVTSEQPATVTDGAGQDTEQASDTLTAIKAKTTGIPAYLLSKEVRPEKTVSSEEEKVMEMTEESSETESDVTPDADSHEEKSSSQIAVAGKEEDADNSMDSNSVNAADEDVDDNDQNVSDEEEDASAAANIEPVDDEDENASDEDVSDEDVSDEDVSDELEDASAAANIEPVDDDEDDASTDNKQVDEESENDHAHTILPQEVTPREEAKDAEPISEDETTDLDNRDSAEEEDAKSSTAKENAHAEGSDTSSDKPQEKEQATEESDHAHTPSETSNVSTDTAEFEAIRDENLAEVKKLSDEELSARIEAMSEAERDQYGHILHNHAVLRQILVAADELKERAKFGVVVQGKDNNLTLNIAKGLVRTSTKDYKSFTGKAAKIKGADLKASKVPEFFKQLHNGALIITSAGRINKDASEALSHAMHENARFTMVLLTDTDKHIRDLMNREPSLEELFKVKVDTEIAGGDDSLVAYGKEYARECEYSIDNLGTLALHSRIEELQTFEHQATIDDVKAIVDEAIAHSSKRKIGHFLEVLSHKRYDDEDMIILREKDFLHQ